MTATDHASTLALAIRYLAWIERRSGQATAAATTQPAHAERCQRSATARLLEIERLLALKRRRADLLDHDDTPDERAAFGHVIEGLEIAHILGRRMVAQSDTAILAARSARTRADQEAQQRRD